MPAGKGVGGDQVWWTLVEDAHVAGDLAALAQSSPFQRFHGNADDAGRQTAQAQPLHVT